MAKADSERVDPEVVGVLGVTHRDVARDALAEAEPAEDPQGPGEFAATVVALLFDGCELRRERHDDLFRTELDAVDRRRGRRTARGRRRVGEGHFIHATPGPCASMRP
jgi:hypothetical protein